MVLQALLLIILARSVTLDEFGTYTTCIAIGTVTAALVGLGIQSRSLWVGSESIATTAPDLLALGVTTALINAVLIAGYARMQFSALTLPAISGITFVCTEMLSLIIINFLFGIHATARAERLLLFRRLLPVVVASLSFVFYPNNIFLVVSLSYVASALVCLLSFDYLPRFTRQLKSATTSGSQYWFASIASTTQQLDQVIIGGAFGPAPAGGFAAAFRTASPVHLLTSSLITLYGPRIRDAPDANSRNHLSRSLLSLGSVYAALLLFLSPFLYFVGPLLFGAQFEVYAWIFPLLFINSAISVVNQVLAGRLYALEQEKRVTVAAVIATVIGIGSALLAAHFGNLYWVVLSTVVAQCIQLIALATLSFGIVEPSPHPQTEQVLINE